MLPFAGLIGLSSFRTFVGGAARTAEQTLPIAIFQKFPWLLEKYNALAHLTLEVAGIGVPFFINVLLSWLGFVGTMWIMPIATVAACVVFIFFMPVPEFSTAPKAGAADTSATPKKESDSRLLKISSWAYPAYVLPNTLLYGIIANAYANHIFTSSVDAAGSAGKTVALYSVGGLIAAAILSGYIQPAWRWVRSKLGPAGPVAPTAPIPLSPVEEKAQALNSLRFWSLMSIAGLVCFVPFIWTNPWLVYIAMVPFGVVGTTARPPPPAG